MFGALKIQKAHVYITVLDLRFEIFMNAPCQCTVMHLNYYLYCFSECIYFLICHNYHVIYV